MKKILSVLMASAMLGISAANVVSAADSNCKIKDIVSDISQYIPCADTVLEKSDCNILNIIGGLRDKLELPENCGICGIGEKTGTSELIFDLIFGKLSTDKNNGDESVEIPEDIIENIPPEKPEETVPPQQDSKPSSDMAQQVTDLVNSYRAQYGLSPVAYDAGACCAAQKRAVEIQSVFSHTRPNGSRCFTALDECGVTYRGAGENIAMGQSDAQQVMNDWMNSQGHRENILNPGFTKLGVGVATGADGRLYWTQMFIY